jgi:alpha-ketoglutarate-dependent taurine dioxygenase
MPGRNTLIMMATLASSLKSEVRRSPFNPDCDDLYRDWRARKLGAGPRSLHELTVPVADAGSPSEAERRALLEAIDRANFAIYRVPADSAADKRRLRQFGRCFGLERLDNNLCADEDGITALHVVEKRQVGEYIPYTNKRLNWHTDGYYNSPQQQIRGVILQCVQPAASGGENAFMDHEIAYILLRDENPGYVRALMAPDAMTIPPNVQNGVELRPEQTGPVFSVDDGGHLHMRYSARGRNIVWKDDALTRAAAQCLLNLFQQDSPYIFRHRLEAGQGIIGNNVLHCRTAFSHEEDGQGRLLYRARYFDRIADIGRER